MRVTILGATGIVGTTLAAELLRFRKDHPFELRLVARSYQNRIENDVEFFRADLLKDIEADKAMAESNVVYVTVGLPFRLSVWEEDWPLIMRNVIYAAKKYHTKLVFFDNVYAYGLVNGPMTEQTPLYPTSQKGVIRQQLQTMLMAEVQKQTLTAVIARSADYYGPYAKSSPLFVTLINNLMKEKKPLWLGNPQKLHSFTYVPDAATALVILGMSKVANNRVWHLPTAAPLKGIDYIHQITEMMHKPDVYARITKFQLTLSGLFNVQSRELSEMFYQFDHDYIFESSQFEKTFGMAPTPYHEGLRRTIQSFKDSP